MRRILYACAVEKVGYKAVKADKSNAAFRRGQMTDVHHRDYE